MIAGMVKEQFFMSFLNKIGQYYCEILMLTLNMKRT